MVDIELMYVEFSWKSWKMKNRLKRNNFKKGKHTLIAGFSPLILFCFSIVENVKIKIRKRWGEVNINLFNLYILYEIHDMYNIQHT